MQSISNFIETKLKWVVNKDKSKVCDVKQTKFLGHTIQKNGTLSVSKQNLEKLKEKVRIITKRNRRRNLEQIVSELNPMLWGWLNYFQKAKCTKIARDIDRFVGNYDAIG